MPESILEMVVADGPTEPTSRASHHHTTMGRIPQKMGAFSNVPPFRRVMDLGGIMLELGVAPRSSSPRIVSVATLPCPSAPFDSGGGW